MRSLIALAALLLSACATLPGSTSHLMKTVIALQNARGETYCSGVAISQKHVVTNGHCAGDGDAHRVKLLDGQTHAIASIRRSSEYDVAVLEIAEPALIPAPLGSSDRVRRGDEVIAVGHPFGREWSVTFGRVANIAIAEPDFLAGLFVMTAGSMINPGSSGGPLFSRQGEIIGINTWVYINKGVGMSLHVDLVKGEIERLCPECLPAEGDTLGGA